MHPKRTKIRGVLSVQRERFFVLFDVLRASKTTRRFLSLVSSLSLSPLEEFYIYKRTLSVELEHIRLLELLFSLQGPRTRSVLRDYFATNSNILDKT